MLEIGDRVLLTPSRNGSPFSRLSTWRVVSLERVVTIWATVKCGDCQKEVNQRRIIKVG